MVPPRQPKGEPTSADAIPVPGGSPAPVDNLYGIYQRLTTIESQVSYTAAAVEDSKIKIEAIAKDVIETKAKFDILRPIGKTIAKGIWAVFIVLVTSLVGFGLTVLGMWLKHHYGW